QGEVGGGKTLVAGAALFFALGQSQGQVVIMAPTEVLARQHFEFLKKPAHALGFEIAFLSGSMLPQEKRAVREGLKSGRIKLAVGTQSLLSPATTFKNLSLAVIDEQHRFGVRQRLSLRRKSEAVDILAMSATPIPRSLALAFYGDLDTSFLYGLLPGRSPAETILYKPEEKQKAYTHFLNLVSQGGGLGFVVTPRIDGDDDEGDSLNPPPSLKGVHDSLKKEAQRQNYDFAKNIRCLHGRMDMSLQKEVMESFRAGDCRILISTSIIEVGVDVPAAGVILIEGAEHFGLAQLHQLRGRVGRGGGPGLCLILPRRLNEMAQARLDALASETNGQILAEMDLTLRGPGEPLGLRQSGWPKMSFAKFPRDLGQLRQAHRLAENLWANPLWADCINAMNIDSAALGESCEGPAD
ncbi:MAG: helicase-related protein, partial [Candidatus Adiutrix sp.]